MYVQECICVHVYTCSTGMIWNYHVTVFLKIMSFIVLIFLNTHNRYMGGNITGTRSLEWYSKQYKTQKEMDGLHLKHISSLLDQLHPHSNFLGVMHLVDQVALQEYPNQKKA